MTNKEKLMVRRTRKLVIDASVSLKWYLEDEEERDKALKLLKDIGSQEVQPTLPSLWIYEVVNGFRSAVIKKRVSKEEAKGFTSEVEALQFPLEDMTNQVEKIIGASLKYNLSAYDAAYVALAQINKCSFITGDKRLYTSLKKQLAFVDWIGNY